MDAPQIPFYLSPLKQWTDADEALLRKPAAGPEFILACIDALLAEGLDLFLAIEVAGNACQETGFGRHYKGWNLGGVKIWKGDDGRWWMAPGHVKSGDPVWCFYKVFGSLQAFFHYWVNHFVPKPGTAPHSRYAETGEKFWSHDLGLHGWFAAMIAAGYKGEVTKAHPDPSDHAEETIELEIREVVAQDLLKHRGLYTKAVDGVWGAGSQAACKAFQKSAGIAETGRPDDLTLWRLTHDAEPLPAWLEAPPTPSQKEAKPAASAAPNAPAEEPQAAEAGDKSSGSAA